MIKRVPTGVRSILAAVVGFAFCAGTYVRSQSAQAPATAQEQPDSSSSSSGHKSNRKPAHHTTVAEEDAPPTDLTKAEELIQKQNYAEAEPLLRKVVEKD